MPDKDYHIQRLQEALKGRTDALKKALDTMYEVAIEMKKWQEKLQAQAGPPKEDTTAEAQLAERLIARTADLKKVTEADEVLLKAMDDAKNANALEEAKKILSDARVKYEAALTGLES